MNMFVKILGSFFAVATLVGCGDQNESVQKDAQTRSTQPTGSFYALTTGDGQSLNLTNVAAIGEYATKNGFIKADMGLKEGQKIFFSTSYGKGEAGQANGKVGADMMFIPGANTTAQLLIAPGTAFSMASLSNSTGKSLWDIKEYSELLTRTALGAREASAQRFAKLKAQGAANNFAGYDAISAKISNVKGTLGKDSVSYSNALVVTLTKKTAAGFNAGSSTTHIVFDKTCGGPVAMQFQEGGMIGGTAQFYRACGSGQ